MLQKLHQKVDINKPHLPEHNQTNIHLWSVVNTRRVKFLGELFLLFPGVWSEEEVNGWRTRGSDLQNWRKIIVNHINYCVKEKTLMWPAKYTTTKASLDE